MIGSLEGIADEGQLITTSPSPLPLPTMEAVPQQFGFVFIVADCK